MLSCRFLLSFSIFLGIAIQYMQRISMSITIVSMVNNTAIKVNVGHHTTIDSISNYSNDTCLIKPMNSTQTVKKIFAYSWLKTLNHLILLLFRMDHLYGQSQYRVLSFFCLFFEFKNSLKFFKKVSFCHHISMDTY